MCQATVYLNNEELMRDVINVQLTPQGIRLVTFFEAPEIVQATLREIDLLKHRVWLETIPERVTREEES
jgi:predicted RNA-binding protein